MGTRGTGRVTAGTILALVATLASAAVAHAASHTARHSASHPDLSGTWALPFEVHSSGVPLTSGQTPWLPASAGDPHQFPILSLQQLSARIDASVREHQGNPLYGMPRPIAAPLTAAGKAALAKINPAVTRKQELDCYPSNVFARVGGGFAPVQIVQSEHAIAMVPDGYFPARIIYLDGRDHDQLPPQWNGLSQGQWQDQSLRVQTDKMRGEELQSGYPISDQAKLTEVFQLVKDGKVLEVDATFEDPSYYTEPLHRLMYLERRPDLQITDYSCEEGKADMIESAQSASSDARH